MFSTALTAFLLTATSTSAYAGTRHVGAGYPFSTIQAAVDASSTDDVVIVHNGTYIEAVVVDDTAIAALTIRAATNEDVVVRAPNTADAAITATDTDLHLYRLTLEAPTASPDDPVALAFTSRGSSSDFLLTMCQVELVGDDSTGSTGVACDAGQDDTHEVRTWGVDYVALDLDASSGCPSFSDGWTTEDVTACQVW